MKSKIVVKQKNIFHLQRYGKLKLFISSCAMLTSYLCGHSACRSIYLLVSTWDPVKLELPKLTRRMHSLRWPALIYPSSLSVIFNRWWGVDLGGGGDEEGVAIPLKIPQQYFLKILLNRSVCILQSIFRKNSSHLYNMAFTSGWGSNN